MILSLVKVTMVSPFTHVPQIHSGGENSFWPEPDGFGSHPPASIAIMRKRIAPTIFSLVALLCYVISQYKAFPCINKHLNCIMLSIHGDSTGSCMRRASRTSRMHGFVLSFQIRGIEEHGADKHRREFWKNIRNTVKP